MRRKAFSVILSLVMMLGIMPQAALPSLAASGDVITFPDANFEAAVRVVIGKPTGAITKGDVENITELDVSSREIADLTGIEHFVALEELNCSINQLTALNISNNTSLTYLDCWANDLAELDLSINTELETLRCAANELTALNVSNNTALTRLNCGANQLTALDVSKNTALTTLDCFNNQLTALDVSNNTALTMLDFRGCQLTELDVSKNPSLIFLGCSSNQLTALDVSKNTELSVLLCSDNYLPSKSAIIGYDGRILGEDTKNAPGFGFADIDAASSWALDAINYVGGADIMAGVGENRFDPKGTFSREQSIIVFNKMG